MKALTVQKKKKKKMGKNIEIRTLWDNFSKVLLRLKNPKTRVPPASDDF